MLITKYSESTGQADEDFEMFPELQGLGKSFSTLLFLYLIPKRLQKTKIIRILFLRVAAKFTCL